MDTTNWQWFKIGDLFDIELSRGDIKYKQSIQGDIPLVSAGESNNGIVGYIDEAGDGIAEIFKGNNITVDMFCNVYYQKDRFYSVSHGRVNILTPKFSMNKYIALFITSLINREKYKYSYGRAVYSNETANITIKLPAKDNKPDWDYIEKFVKESIFPKLPSKSLDVWNNTLDTSPIINEKYSLNTDNWKWFKIGELFDIEKGHEIIKELTEGETPLISAKYGNNGVDSFVYSPTEIFEGDVITTSSNGQPGISYYQQNKFCATGDVNILIPKFKTSSYICLFISTIIENETYRFNYGRKWGKGKMEIHKIKLPATQDGEPDWVFMENYIKSLPYSRMI
ncbi:MAG: restriction endonuclease subunit S [Bacteroidales bacterium]|nr:restriction endonuclease subunit S [Bacteroidales bacterium]